LRQSKLWGRFNTGKGANAHGLRIQAFVDCAVAERGYKGCQISLLAGIAPGQAAIASFTAPAILQPVLVTYFRAKDGLMFMCGTGTVKSVDP
jgi:hypothetical protein